MRKKDDTSEALIGCLLLLITVPLSAIWRGYILSILWGWFIVSTFEAPPLGVAAAIGVSLVISYLTKQNDEYKDESKSQMERVIQSIVYAFLDPAVALAFGWAVHAFL